MKYLKLETICCSTLFVQVPSIDKRYITKQGTVQSSNQDTKYCCILNPNFTFTDDTITWIYGKNKNERKKLSIVLQVPQFTLVIEGFIRTSSFCFIDTCGMTFGYNDLFLQI